MSYEPRPDSSGDTLLNSRDQIRTNFEIIQNRFEDNHATFDGGTGHHERIDFNEQSSFPATAANESWLASREYNTRTELAWRPESTGAAGDQFILSAMPIRAAARFQIAASTGARPTIGRSFNITSITQVSQTRFTVVMQTAAPSINYFIIGNKATNNGGTAEACGIDYTFASHADDTFQIRIPSGSTNDNLQFIIYGG